MYEIIKENCLKKIKNKFDLIIIASKIGRNIQLENIKPTIDVLNDKVTITALKEIEKNYNEESKFK